MALSDVELLDALASSMSNFSNYISEGTKKQIEENGLLATSTRDADVLGRLVALSLTFADDIAGLKVADARDLFDNAGLGYMSRNTYGEDVRLITIEETRPITPMYRDLTEGSSVDMYKRRNPKMKEIFMRRNLDFQNVITIGHDEEMTKMLMSGSALSALTAGYRGTLRTSWVKNNNNIKFKLLGAILNDSESDYEFKLKDTQKITTPIADPNSPTGEELKNFTQTLKYISEIITSSEDNSAFNAYGYQSVQNVEDLVLLVRPSYKPAMSIQTELGAFNPDKLALPFPVKTFQRFSELEPYKEEAFTTPLYPVYDEHFGYVIGYSETSGQKGSSNVTVQTKDVKWKDPLADTYAVLVDKNFFRMYMYEPLTYNPTPYNPAMRTTNIFANSQGNTIAYDPRQTVIRFDIK